MGLPRLGCPSASGPAARSKEKMGRDVGRGHRQQHLSTLPCPRSGKTGGQGAPLGQWPGVSLSLRLGQDGAPL